MKPNMRRTLTLLLPGIWAVAFAQTPPGGEQAAGIEAGGQGPPCVPVTDTLHEPAGSSGPLEGQPKDAGQAAVPCVEEAPEAASGEDLALEEGPGESAADAEENVEETPNVEVSADEVFRPEDEISEDYPVPLPSDM
jgi:hypothetical protein